MRRVKRIAPVGVGIRSEWVAKNRVGPDFSQAEAARAAATTARINVEINLAGVTDAEARAGLAASVVPVDDLAARAERVTAQVRSLIAS